MNVASRIDIPVAAGEHRPLGLGRTSLRHASSESPRFTRDGSVELEGRLGRLCQQVFDAIRQVIAERKIAALILAGGYGRGEGGVLRTELGDQPYNDLEFYLFLHGGRLLNEFRFASKLHTLAARLTPAAGVDIEIKIDSVEDFHAKPVSMFSYDLVSHHQTIHGPNQFFQRSGHHMDPARIPASEAARLLLNRATGLLLAKAILDRANPSRRSATRPRKHPPPTDAVLRPEESDFVERNLAKMRLGLGDAFLAGMGEYHWSCLERHSRLTCRTFRRDPPWFGRMLEEHAKGVKFKLHPHRSTKSVEEFNEEFEQVSGLAREVWLWLESQRLARRFSGLQDYALSPCQKCEPAPVWRNRLLNLRTFGWSGLFWKSSSAYPRERLFNSLPLLLWSRKSIAQPGIARHLQAQLVTPATDWEGFLSAYRRVWIKYG